MAAKTKAQLVEENDALREKLDIYINPDKFRLVEYKDGVWSFQAPWFPVLVGTMAQMLKDFDAKNYIEIDSYHDGVGPLTVTVQKKWAKTPHELRKEAEGESERLREVIRRYVDAEAAVAKGGYGGPIHHYERERDEALAALAGEASPQRKPESTP